MFPASTQLFGTFLSGLSSNGTLAFGSGDGNSILSYKYDVVEDNHNGRTFQSFSTLAADVLASYPTFQKHVAYFGQPDYADHIVLVGFDSGTTDLKNGNVDFTGFSALGEEHGGKS